MKNAIEIMPALKMPKYNGMCVDFVITVFDSALWRIQQNS